MGDPTGLAGWAGGKILETLYSELQHARMFAEEWNSFKVHLDSLRNVVNEMDNNLRHNSGGYHLVQLWLNNVEKCLRESRQLLESSHDVKIWNRSKICKRIISKREELQKLVSDPSVDKLLLINTTAKADQILSELSTLAKRGGQDSQAMASKLVALRSFRRKSFVVGLEVDVCPFTPTPEPTFGRVNIMKELEDLLCSDGSPSFIGLHGMGGAGKTFVAKAVSDLPCVRSHFQHLVGWITLGKDYDITNLKNKIQEIYSDSRRAMKHAISSVEERDTHAISSVEERDTHKVGREKMFLVLDDVWTMDILEFVVKDNRWIEGTKLIITTRETKLLKAFTVIHPIAIGTLEQGESFDLFIHHAFPCRKQDDIPKVLKSVAKHVALECKGLPLALKVIGKAMAGKGLSEWDETLSKLRNQELIDDDHEKLLIERLRISYDALKDLEVHVGSKLQDCFLYFGAFKEDEEIYVYDLMKCWMGEDLLRHDRTTLEATYTVIGVLLASSLIEMPDEDYYTVHDILRDLTFHISRKEKQDENLFQPACNTPPSEVSRNVSRISWRGIHFSPIEVKINASNLQVLLLDELDGQTKFISQEFVDACILKFHSLQVLSLKRTSIKTLPSSLGRLRRLVVLDLSDSTIEFIPSSLRKLRELKYLSISDCNNLISFPFEALLELKNLQVLGMRSVAWAHQRSVIWKVLLGHNLSRCFLKYNEMEDEAFMQLRNLQNLWLLSLGINKKMDAPEILSNMKNLRQLLLDGPIMDMEQLKGLVKLDLLCLENSMVRRLPDWICNFSSLEKLTIDTKDPKADHIPALERLPRLRRLGLSGWESLTHLPSSYGHAGGFPSLEYLVITNCKSLKELPDLQAGAFPALKYLLIMGSTNLSMMPPSWGRRGHFAQLEGLKIDACMLPEIEEGAFPQLKYLEVVDPIYLEKSGDFGIDWKLITNLDMCKHMAIEVPPSWMSYGRLQNLQELTLSFHMEKIPEVSAGAFQKLKILNLLGGLVEFSLIGVGALPRLQQFACKFESSEIPSCFWQFLEELSLLDHIELCGHNGTTNFETWGCTRVPERLLLYGFKTLPLGMGKKESQFAALCYLQIYYSDNLKELPNADLGCLPLLESITIGECMQLRAIPYSYSVLPRLQNVRIIRCPQLMSWTISAEGIAFAGPFDGSNWIDNKEKEQATLRRTLI